MSISPTHRATICAPPTPAHTPQLKAAPSPTTVAPPAPTSSEANTSATVQNYDAADFNPVQSSIDTTRTTNFYVNGVRTPEDKAEEARQFVAQNLGEDVQLLYNPTEGLLKDGFEAWKNLSGFDTEIASQVEKQFQAVLDREEKVKVFAHSQGSAITSDALRNIADQYAAQGKSPEEVKALMSQVEVIGFGGFADYESFPDGVKVTLQRNKEDHIPQLASASLAVGNAFEAVQDSPKDSKKWWGLGKAIVGGVGTLGKTVLKNGVQAVGSAIENRGELKKAFSAENVNRQQIDAYFAKVSTTVESDHLAIICNPQGQVVAGYIDDYFKTATV